MLATGKEWKHDVIQQQHIEDHKPKVPWTSAQCSRLAKSGNTTSSSYTAVPKVAPWRGTTPYRTSRREEPVCEGGGMGAPAAIGTLCQWRPGPPVGAHVTGGTSVQPVSWGYLPPHSAPGYPC
jgi:hypothetical protein